MIWELDPFRRPIIDMLIERLPVTIGLGLAAIFLLSSLVSRQSLFAALRRNSAADVSVMIGANLGVSHSRLCIGIDLIYIFAVLLRDTPFCPAAVRTTITRCYLRAVL